METGSVGWSINKASLDHNKTTLMVPQENLDLQTNKLFKYQ